MLKHILIVGKYYPPEFGGMERYTHDVARVAAKAHRVTVVAHHGKPANDSIECNGNITVIRCRTNKIVKAQPISLSMLSHLRTLKPDLVHFNAPNFWAAAMLQICRYDAPVIVTHHADVFGRRLLKQAVLPIYHRLARKAVYVVVNSRTNFLQSKDLPRNLPRPVAIPHGVEAGIYQIDSDFRKQLMAERHRRFGSAPVVGFVGRFVRYKGLGVLVDALAELDGVHCLLIGDGPLMQQTRDRVRAAGLGERVHFLGTVDEREKVRNLAMLDALLLPSVETTEAFGVVQIEAQLMKIPVIASRLPTGVVDVTIDNETGLLVSPGDAKALATAISRIVGDRDLATRLGRAGHDHALRNFTFDVFERRLEELFDVALSGRPVEETHPDFAPSALDFSSCSARAPAGEDTALIG